MNSDKTFRTGLHAPCAFAPPVLTSLVALSACSSTDKALEPLSPQGDGRSAAAQNLKVGAPLFVRVFKEENQMEVWLQQAYGPHVLFRTYDICSRSGVLGPKYKEGDRQAPEGFYMVSQRQMNPKSAVLPVVQPWFSQCV